MIARPRAAGALALSASLLWFGCRAESRSGPASSVRGEVLTKHPEASSVVDPAGTVAPEDTATTEAPISPIYLTPDRAGGVPLTLLVSNQSSSAPRVDLTVSIDGHVIFSQDIEMRNMGNFVLTRIVHLRKGAHRIEAHSKLGEVQLDEKFKVSQPRWATLSYWYEGTVQIGTPVDRALLFTMHDKPVSFH